MGMPINDKGEIESENVTLACRNATRNMMSLLQERGYTMEQARGRSIGARTRSCPFERDYLWTHR